MTDEEAAVLARLPEPPGGYCAEREEEEPVLLRLHAEGLVGTCRIWTPWGEGKTMWWRTVAPEVGR
jgi:hypothetical protein